MTYSVIVMIYTEGVKERKKMCGYFPNVADFVHKVPELQPGIDRVKGFLSSILKEGEFETMAWGFQ